MRNRVPVLAILVAFACGDDPADNDTSGTSGGATQTTSPTVTSGDASTSTAGEETGDVCTAGTEKCPCIDGQCLEGLQCLSDICVEDLPPIDPPDPSTTGAGGSTGGIPECSQVFACGDGEICWLEECVPQDGFAFEVELQMWGPSDPCNSLDLDSEPELFANLLVAGEQFDATATVNSCPAIFNEVFCLSPSQIATAFLLQLWEYDDVSPNDYVDGFCWANTENPNVCGRIPPAWLTYGSFNEAGSWGSIILAFSPVESCG